MRTSTLIAPAALAGAASAFDCTPAALSSLLPSNASASINFAHSVADNGTFPVDSGNVGYPDSPEALQSLCAVSVNVKDVDSNTHYNFGLFLPTKWNNRFFAVGNGGFIGSINWLDMANGAGYGFAALSTDTGHNSTAFDASWAQDNPEVVNNWGYRALHGSVVLGKQIVESFYGSDIAYSYYSGCSAGGKQGFKEAEEFPDDFDGIIAGAPAWWTTHLQLWNGWVGIVNAVGADTRIDPSLFSIIGDEVLRQCDPQDGLVDNVISDPMGCNFNPWTLLCPANVTDSTISGCLNAPQIDTVYKLYSDWVVANQTFVFPHFQLGSETEWGLLVGAEEPAALMTDYVKYMLGYGPDWDWHNWDDSIIATSDRINPGHATANNFDISPFAKKGGKLIHYHGLSDGSIATGSSIYLYNQILAALTPKGFQLDDFYRFFLVPGMQHCVHTPESQHAPWFIGGANQAGALGTDFHGVPGFADSKHDVVLAIMAWVENGTAPDDIIATTWVNDTKHEEVYRQRPICKYPTQAKYIGKGSADEAKNWRCESLYETMILQ